MAIVVENPWASVGKAISQGAGTLAQAYRSSAQKEKELKEQRKHAGLLGDVLQTAQNDPSTANITGALGEALKQGLPIENALNFAKIYANNSKAQQGLDSYNPEQFQSALTSMGIPQEVAQQASSLFGQLQPGGQTLLMQQLFDKAERGEFGTQQPPMEMVQEEETIEEFPPINIFEGLNRKEKAKFQAQVYKDNQDHYGDIRDKQKALKAEDRSLTKLRQLNETGKLPQGLARVNINRKSGKLILPAGANKETQLFVKLINDFTTEARDTFGARVTNFELNTFLQRLPTLANTSEGREEIIKYMSNVNNINQNYYDNIVDTYNHYGLRNIDRQNVEQIAEKRGKDREKELMDSFMGNDNEVIMEFQGKRIAVHPEDLQEALKAGAKKL